MPEFQEHFAKVYRFALHLSQHHQTAEDIAQECRLKAIGKNQESESAGEIPWLFQVARNLWLDRLKSAEFKRRVDTLDLDFDCELSSLNSIEEQDEIKMAMSAMSRLPDRQRQVPYLT